MKHSEENIKRENIPGNGMCRFACDQYNALPMNSKQQLY